MGLGWKIGLGALGVYLAIPLVRRVANGCPAVSGKSALIPMVGGAAQMTQVCKPLGAAELLIWPLGFFAVQK